MNSNVTESNLNLIKSKFNQIQKKISGMQIVAQAIETMLITFIIHDYDVEKEKNYLRKGKHEK